MPKFSTQIKDGELQISSNMKEYFREKNGEYIITVEKRKCKRTLQQNKAMHKYFSMITEELNNSGITLNILLDKIEKNGVETMATPTLIKEILWRKIQIAMFDKISTKQLFKTGEIEKIVDVINKLLSEIGIEYVPFPSYEN